MVNKIMRKLLIFIVLFTLSGGAYANEDLKMDGVSADYAQGYLDGLAYAYLLTNLKAESNGAPLFCLSRKLDSQEIYKLADSKLSGPHKPELFAIASFDALTTNNNCN